MIQALDDPENAVTQDRRLASMKEQLKLVDGQLSIDLLGDWGYSSEKLGGDVCLGLLSLISLVACLFFWFCQRF